MLKFETKPLVTQPAKCSSHRINHLRINLHNNVVDRDVNQLDEKSNEAHDSKSNSSGHGNFLELCRKSKESSIPARDKLIFLLNVRTKVTRKSKATKVC